VSRGVRRNALVKASERHGKERPTRFGVKERYAAEKEEFQRLISELKRLASKKGYSVAQIASEVGVTQVTVNHWWTGYSLTARRDSIERLKKLLAAH
jgi:hypothetical protein